MRHPQHEDFSHGLCHLNGHHGGIAGARGFHDQIGTDAVGFLEDDFDGIFLMNVDQTVGTGFSAFAEPRSPGSD